ncbi:MAG: hypothetical protein ACRD20_02365 [Terriglobales bacterium]
MSYPYVRCEVTGRIQPGYALCVHLAANDTMPIGEVKAPTKKSLGVIVCAACSAKALPGLALVVCCAPCVESGLLRTAGEA